MSLAAPASPSTTEPPFLALIGERDVEKRAHAGIEGSIARFVAETEQPLPFRWISTATLTPDNVGFVLQHARGVWCVPGSPYARTSGAFEAIRHARVNRLPFLGTCGGYQHALMEYVSSVLGRAAEHAEMNPSAEQPLIAPLACALKEASGMIRAVPGSGFSALLGGEQSREEYHCAYGLNQDQRQVFERSAIEFVAQDEAGQIRAFRHREHPFFVGTLFQPERRALGGELHPLVRAFFRSAQTPHKRAGETSVGVECWSAAEAELHAEALVELLRDSVEHGASIGFLTPLAQADAAAFWRDVIADVEKGTRVLLVTRTAEKLSGSVQLGLCQRANGRHRAEVQKLLVHTSSRRQGLARALMLAVESEARERGRSLLYLDTEPEQPAETLYRKLGWILAGRIPNYACTPSGHQHPTALFYKEIALDSRPAGETSPETPSTASPQGQGPKGVSFRLAVPADVDALRELIPLAVRSLQAGFYSERQREGAIGTVFGVDRQLIKDGTYFVAVDGDRIVGCGGWSRRRTSYGSDQARIGEDPLRDPAVEPAMVRAFFVHPEFARRGIGRRLMELSEAAARADGFRALEIVATLPGEALYSKFDYAVTERMEIDLSNGEKMKLARMRKSWAP